MLYRRNESIGFWRFIFSLLIVLFHMQNSTELTYTIFGNGYIVVNFFFILSGFLLIESYERKFNSELSVLKNSFEFIKCKVIKFSPLWYFSLAIIFIYRIYIFHSTFSFEQLGRYIFSIIPEIFMLNGLFYINMHVNGPTWYISILLIVSFLFSILIGIIKKRNINQKFIFIIILCTAYLLYCLNKISNTGIVNLLRGIYLMALGILLGFLYRKIKDIKYYKIFSVIEIVNISVMCVYMYNNITIKTEFILNIDVSI